MCRARERQEAKLGALMIRIGSGASERLEETCPFQRGAFPKGPSNGIVYTLGVKIPSIMVLGPFGFND